MTQLVASQGTEGLLGITPKKKKPTNIAARQAEEAAIAAGTYVESPGVDDGTEVRKLAPQVATQMVSQPAPVAQVPTTKIAPTIPPTSNQTQTSDAMRSGVVYQAGRLGFDRQALETELIGETEREAQDARERLARQYGIDPGGADSGMSQRAFETLEGDVLGAKSNIRTQLRQVEGEENRANLAAFLGAQGTLQGQDVATAGLTGFYGGYQTIAGKEQESLADIRSRQTAVQESQQALQDKIAKAEATGKWDELDTLQAQSLELEQQRLQLDKLEQQAAAAARTAGLTGSLTTAATASGLGVNTQGIFNTDGTLASINKWVEARDGVISGLASLGITDATEDEIDTILRGGTVARIAQTLAAQEQTDLQGIRDRQTTIQEEQQALQAQIAEAEATGDWEGLDTLQKQNLALEQERLQLDKLEQQAVLAMQKAGIVGAWEAAVTAEGLGIDTEGLFNAAGNFNSKQARDAAVADARDKLASMGITDATDDEIKNMLRGETINRFAETLAAKAQREANELQLATLLGKYGVDETPTLAANQQALEAAQLTGLFEGAPTLQALAQTFAQSMSVAELTGILEREDSEDLETLAKAAQDFMEEIEAAKLTGTYAPEDQEAVDTLQKQLQDSQIALEQAAQRIQLQALANEQFRFLTQETGVVGVDGTLDAMSIGVDVSGVFKPNGDIDTAEYAKVADKLTAAFQQLGIDDMSQGDIMKLIKGETVKTEKTATLGARRMVLENAVNMTAQQLDREIAKAAATGYWGDVATLEFLRYEQSSAVEKEELQLKWNTQLQQTAANRAALTGEYGGGPLSAQDLGMPQYTVDTVGYWGDNLVSRFTSYAGRPPTEEEVAALTRGQTIDLGGTKTLAQKQQEIDEALNRAQLSGLLWDPVTKKNIDTLQKEKQDFDQDLATQQQEFDEMMALAETTGYMTVGNDGVISAQDLGVNVSYVSDLPPDDILDTVEAQKLRDRFQLMVGKTPTDNELIKLLRSQTIDAGDEVRVQTVSAMMAERQMALAEGSALGNLYGQQTQAAKEFEKTLLNTTNLTTAEISQINANISLATKQLNQQIFEFAQTSAMNFADMFGTVGESGQVTASELGFDIPSAYKKNPGDTLAQTLGRIPEDQREEAKALADGIRSTLEALGEDSSDDNVNALLTGKQATVSGRKTLGALSLAATVTQQNLERATDMLKFSKNYDLDTDKFNQAVKESDRNYALTAKEVAQQYGLEVDKFMLAKYQLDTELTGRLGVDGDISLGDLMLEKPIPSGQITPDVLGFSAEEIAANITITDAGAAFAKGVAGTQMIQELKDYIEAHPEGFPPDRKLTALDYGKFFSGQPIGQASEDSMATYQEDYNRYLTNIKNRMSMLLGRDLTGDELQDLLAGGAVTAESMPSFSREQWADATARAAEAFDLDLDSFQEATRQFDKNFEQAEANTYAQLFGTDIDDPEKFTLNYQQYKDAKDAFDVTEEQRDYLWQQMKGNEQKVREIKPADIFSNGWVTPEDFSQVAIDVEKNAPDIGQAELLQLDGAFPVNAASLGFPQLVGQTLIEPNSSNPTGYQLVNPDESLSLYLELEDAIRANPQMFGQNPATYNALSNRDKNQVTIQKMAEMQEKTDPTYIQGLVQSSMGVAVTPEIIENVMRNGGTFKAVDPEAIETAQIAYVKDRMDTVMGFPVSESQVRALLEGSPITVSYLSVGDNELATMANFVNGNAMAIASNNNSGGGLASLAGTIVGATVGFVAAGPTGIVPGAQAGAMSTSQLD